MDEWRTLTFSESFRILVFQVSRDDLVDFYPDTMLFSFYYNLRVLYPDLVLKEKRSGKDLKQLLPKVKM